MLPILCTKISDSYFASAIAPVDENMADDQQIKADTNLSEDKPPVFFRYVTFAIINIALFFIAHMLLSNLITPYLSGGPIAFTSIAFAIGALSVFGIGAIFGAGRACKEYPAIGLIGHVIVIAGVFWWSTTQSLGENYGTFGLFNQNFEIILAGLKYDWPHYVFFLGSVVSLLITVLRKKGEIRITINAKTKIVFVAIVTLFFIATCFILPYLSDLQLKRNEQAEEIAWTKSFMGNDFLFNNKTR